LFSTRLYIVHISLLSNLTGGAAFGGPQVAPFPAPATLSCSFDQQLLRAIGVQFAEEAKSKGVTLLLSPNFNLLRDPRAGRNFEVFGEDALVVGLLGGALVEGCQGEGVGVW
jgi:beta-glucosidase